MSAGTVVSIESEGNGWEGGPPEGEEQQLRIDAEGQRVVSGPADDPADAEDPADNQQYGEAEIDYRDAVSAMEGEISGARINELGLDRDNGRTLWEADVTAGNEQRSVMRLRMNGVVGSGTGVDRERERDGGPLRATVQLDLTALSLGDSLDDRKPETG